MSQIGMTIPKQAINTCKKPTKILVFRFLMVWFGFYWYLKKIIIMASKILILSKNNISENFWRTVIRTDQTKILKWTNIDMTLLNLQSIFPDVIVVDDYFRSQGNDNWIKAIIEKITMTGYSKQIFCLSPVYSSELSKPNYDLLNLECYNFNEEFIDHLNLSVGTKIRKKTVLSPSK